MSAIANIAIQDGQATPATHTFYPVQSDPSAIYRENQSTLPIVGQGLVSVVFRSAINDGLQKVRLSIDLPALEAVVNANSSGYTAAPKVAYTNRAIIDLILPARGTAAQRKDLRVLLSNLLLNAQVIDAVENLNRPY